MTGCAWGCGPVARAARHCPAPRPARWRPVGARAGQRLQGGPPSPPTQLPDPDVLGTWWGRVLLCAQHLSVHLGLPRHSGETTATAQLGPAPRGLTWPPSSAGQARGACPLLWLGFEVTRTETPSHEQLAASSAKCRSASASHSRGVSHAWGSPPPPLAPPAQAPPGRPHHEVPHFFRSLWSPA